MREIACFCSFQAMLVSSSPKLRDNSMSPNYHHRHYTPPRSSAQQYDSPMLRLRQNTSLQSPRKSTAQPLVSNPFFTNMPQPIPADDEEGSIFLSSAASDSFTSFFTSSSSRIDDSHLEADEDMFFGPDSSFVLNITNETPSPRSKTALPMNFKHRNSLLISDEDDTDSSAAGDFLQPMPTYDLMNEPGVDVDAFIIKTLAAASKGPHLPPKKIPGTPVKKVRMSYFGNERPWQSAVASKVGLRDAFDFNKKKVPRKSLPAVFPPTGAKPSCDQTTDSEDEQESPITRREKYANVGLGQPSCKNAAVSGIPRSRWLMRRCSSGAISSGSDSASLASTPTRSKGIGKEKSDIFACCILTRFLLQQIGTCLNPEYPPGFLHQAMRSRCRPHDLSQDRRLVLSPP